MNSECGVRPLPKHLFEKMVAAKIEKLGIHLEGGSDEGLIDCSLSPWPNSDENPNLRKTVGEILNEVEIWAFDAYSFSGAGDGTRYGDDIEYDLVNKTVTTTEWYESVKLGQKENETLELEDEGDEEVDLSDSNELEELNKRFSEVDAAYKALDTALGQLYAAAYVFKNNLNK